MRSFDHVDLALIGLLTMAAGTVFGGCGGASGNAGSDGSVSADASLPDPDAGDSNGHVGSAVCQSCHPTIHASFSQHGHNFAMNRIVGAAPSYPESTVPAPPTGYAYDDGSIVMHRCNRNRVFAFPTASTLDVVPGLTA